MASAKDIANRVPITACLMLATVMTSLDSTIANVALPHIQGSVSASQDQITWVLTSYIIATAIMTPLTGWLSVRIGRKQMFLISIAGFTAASMLCGIASSLPEIVAFRLLQGACGAALVPLSQAVLLDIFPPERIGQMMAIWGAGAIMGPILGPVIGGWLTDNLTWRWVFFINLPVGVLGFFGLWLFMDSKVEGQSRPFDFLGFGALVLFIGGFQLVVDRGPTQDWFASSEIWTEAIISAIGLWLFIVQTLTARQPFFDRALLADRNFVTCTVFGAFVGVFLFSTMALLPPMLQNLMGYSVFDSGLVTMPRGVGSFVAMFVVGQMIGRFDTRAILLLGLSLNAYAMWRMTQWDISMGSGDIVWTGVVQGLGIGLLFTPLSALAFATLDASHRPEATSVYTLMRSLGSSIGISSMQALLTSNTQTVHSTMASQVQRGNPVVSAGLPPPFDPATPSGLQALNGEVTRQAAMVAYVDDFKLMLLMTFALMPLLFIMRTPRLRTQEMSHVVAD